MCPAGSDLEAATQDAQADLPLQGRLILDGGTVCNRCKGMRTFANLTAQAEPSVERLDLTAYAREHRYRLRNLHDGGPVPPARYRRSKGEMPAGQAGYIGQDDRQDAIVGCDGYIVDEGEPGQLGIYLQYRSGRGVRRAHARIQAMGGTVSQVGDTEIAGTVPVNRVEDALKLIRVSRVPMRNPNPKFGTVSGGRT